MILGESVRSPIWNQRTTRYLIYWWLYKTTSESKKCTELHCIGRDRWHWMCLGERIFKLLEQMMRVPPLSQGPQVVHLPQTEHTCQWGAARRYRVHTSRTLITVGMEQIFQGWARKTLVDAFHLLLYVINSPLWETQFSSESFTTHAALSPTYTINADAPFGAPNVSWMSLSTATQS